MYEDAISPKIRLFADGVEIQNHDTIIDGRIIHNYPYVGVQPKFDIYIYDNSPLPIEDAKNLKVNLNSKIQTSETSKGYELKFFPFAEPSHLKAYITFIPDSLDFGLNYIWITARDATGNRDSLFLYLNVSLNGYITDLKNYPNPFNNETNFEFNYKGPSTEGNFNINIYNILGERIKKIISPIHIGNNIARWDAYDESGRSLPVGAYFYIITVDGYLYVDPVKGRCIIGR